MKEKTISQLAVMKNNVSRMSVQVRTVLVENTELGSFPNANLMNLN